VLANSAVAWGASGQTITAAAPQVSMWQNHGRASSGVVPPMVSNGLPAGIGNVFFNRVSIFNPIQATRAILTAAMLNASGGGSYTLQLGIYTMNHSTASLASSASVGVSWTTGSGGVFSSVTSVWGGQSSLRARTIALGTWNMPAGEYLIGFLGSYTAAAASRSWSFNGSAVVPVVSMPGTLSTVPYFPPQGTYSHGTTVLPVSVRVQDLAASINEAPGLSCVPNIVFVGTF